MSFEVLSVNAKSIAFEQLEPIIPPSSFSSEFSELKPEWCVKPLNIVKLFDIGNGVAIDLNDFHIIGRGEKSSIVIESLFVSRCHAALLHHCSGEFYLIDLASTHGTFIGHNRLMPYIPTIVRRGSLIRFGTAINQYMLSSFPSMKQIISKARRIYSEYEKTIFINTEHNRRIPIQVSDTKSHEIYEDGSFQLIHCDMLANTSSHSPAISAQQVRSYLTVERLTLSRRDTFDLSECGHSNIVQVCNASALLKKRDSGFIDDSCSHEQEISEYSRSFESRLQRHRKAVQSSSAIVFLKKRRCMYAGDVQPHLCHELTDIRHDNDVVSDELFTNCRRVRFQLPAIDAHGSSSYTNDSSDDGSVVDETHDTS